MTVLPLASLPWPTAAMKRVTFHIIDCTKNRRQLVSASVPSASCTLSVTFAMGQGGILALPS